MLYIVKDKVKNNFFYVSLNYGRIPIPSIICHYKTSVYYVDRTLSGSENESNELYILKNFFMHYKITCKINFGIYYEMNCNFINTRKGGYRYVTVLTVS